MASDGKGQRKHRAPLCPKCNDRGWVFVGARVRGRLVGPYSRRRCLRCAAGKQWKEEKPP